MMMMTMILLRVVGWFRRHHRRGPLALRTFRPRDRSPPGDEMAWGVVQLLLRNGDFVGEMILAAGANKTLVQ